MSITRLRYSPTLTAKLALEVIKEQRMLAEIASEAKVHPNLLSLLKK